MIDQQSVQTDCGHTFCLKCLVQWQKTCHASSRSFSCPSCTQVIHTYDPFHWPQRLINNVLEVGKDVDDRLRQQKSRMLTMDGEWNAERNRYVAQLQVCFCIVLDFSTFFFAHASKQIESERNKLQIDQQRIATELERDRQAQRDLQIVINEFRANEERTLRAKDDEMSRLKVEDWLFLHCFCDCC
jgi:hypothetical protein